MTMREKHQTMRATISSMLGVAALATLAACNNAKSPDSAARDISAANNQAAQEMASAQSEAQKDLSNDAYNVAIAQADGDHKIAVQKCETLQGHDQQVCKDQADADYEAAKANAKAAKVAQTP
jgi:predicted small lipoprotein YifL